MPPPCFCDLGKSARDLFFKGYNYGFFKLEAKSKTDSGLQFTTAGYSNSDNGKFSGSLETKYKCPKYGLSFKEQWTSDNELNTVVTIEDQLAKGLKLALDTSFAPFTGRKGGQIKTGFKQDSYNITADVVFDYGSPIVHGAGVLGYKRWLTGYQMMFDTAGYRFSNISVAFGYSTDDFTLHTSINDWHDFAGSLYKRVSKNLEMAVNLTWTSSTNVKRFAVSTKYTMNGDSSLHIKVNNSGGFAIGYTEKLRDGLKLTMSVLLEAKTIHRGTHKVGMGLEIET